MNVVANIMKNGLRFGTRKLVSGTCAISLIFFVSCESDSSISPVNQSQPILTSQFQNSAEISPEHFHVLAKYGGVYKDVQVENTVARITGRLITNTEDPSQNYRITILNSQNINAFALPGGYIYITRGLLALANDSSEVAAVLAHEIGHITAGHALARLRRTEDADFANQVLSNVVDDPTVAKLAVEKSRLSLAQFSRAQELHADVIGVRTVAKAGYDPHSTARFLQLREKYSRFLTAGRSNSGQVDYLATHPSTPERTLRAKYLARQYGAPGIGDRDRKGYLEGIDGILFGDDPEGGFVHGSRYYQKNLGISFEIPLGYVLENSPNSVLFSHSDGAAFRFDGIELGRDESLSDYISSGWINGLEEQNIRPKTVNGLPAIIASTIVEGRAFRIAVIRVGEFGYRFIAATRNADESFESSFNSTVESFKQLSTFEQSRLKPLQIRIINATEGDTPLTLARKMDGIQASQRLELFNFLNGIQSDSEIEEGMQFKVVVGQ